MSGIRKSKSIERIPDFRVEDIRFKFALWLQELKADRGPGVLDEIADVTFTASSTVRQWCNGSQAAGMEATLRALAYIGPTAINKVLLEPMGMTGARWSDEASPALNHLYAAKRELQQAVAELEAQEPAERDTETKLGLALNLGELSNSAMRHLIAKEPEPEAAGSRAAVVDLDDRRRA